MRKVLLAVPVAVAAVVLSAPAAHAVLIVDSCTSPVHGGDPKDGRPVVPGQRVLCFYDI